MAEQLTISAFNGRTDCCALLPRLYSNDSNSCVRKCVIYAKDRNYRNIFICLREYNKFFIDSLYFSVL